MSFFSQDDGGASFLRNSKLQSNPDPGSKKQEDPEPKKAPKGGMFAADDDEDDDFGFGEFDVDNLDDDPEEVAPVTRQPKPVISNTGSLSGMTAIENYAAERANAMAKTAAAATAAETHSVPSPSTTEAPQENPATEVAPCSAENNPTESVITSEREDPAVDAPHVPQVLKQPKQQLQPADSNPASTAFAVAVSNPPASVQEDPAVITEPSNPDLCNPAVPSRPAEPPAAVDPPEPRADLITADHRADHASTIGLDPPATLDKARDLDLVPRSDLAVVPDPAQMEVEQSGVEVTTCKMTESDAIPSATVVVTSNPPSSMDGLEQAQVQGTGSKDDVQDAVAMQDATGITATAAVGANDTATAAAGDIVLQDAAAEDAAAAAGAAAVKSVVHGGVSPSPQAVSSESMLQPVATFDGVNAEAAAAALPLAAGQMESVQQPVHLDIQSPLVIGPDGVCLPASDIATTAVAVAAEAEAKQEPSVPAAAVVSQAEADVADASMSDMLQEHSHSVPTSEALAAILNGTSTEVLAAAQEPPAATAAAAAMTAAPAAQTVVAEPAENLALLGPFTVPSNPGVTLTTSAAAVAAENAAAATETVHVMAAAAAALHEQLPSVQPTAQAGHMPAKILPVSLLPTSIESSATPVLVSAAPASSPPAAAAVPNRTPLTAAAAAAAEAETAQQPAPSPDGITFPAPATLLSGTAAAGVSTPMPFSSTRVNHTAPTAAAPTTDDNSVGRQELVAHVLPQPVFATPKAKVVPAAPGASSSADPAVQPCPAAAFLPPTPTPPAAAATAISPAVRLVHSNTFGSPIVHAAAPAAAVEPASTAAKTTTAAAAAATTAAPGHAAAAVSIVRSPVLTTAVAPAVTAGNAAAAAATLQRNPMMLSNPFNRPVSKQQSSTMQLPPMKPIFPRPAMPAAAAAMSPAAAATAAPMPAVAAISGAKSGGHGLAIAGPSGGSKRPRMMPPPAIRTPRPTTAVGSSPKPQVLPPSISSAVRTSTVFTSATQNAAITASNTTSGLQPNQLPAATAATTAGAAMQGYANHPGAATASGATQPAVPLGPGSHARASHNVSLGQTCLVQNIKSPAAAAAAVAAVSESAGQPPICTGIVPVLGLKATDAALAKTMDAAAGNESTVAVGAANNTMIISTTPLAPAAVALAATHAMAAAGAATKVAAVTPGLSSSISNDTAAGVNDQMMRAAPPPPTAAAAAAAMNTTATTTAAAAITGSYADDLPPPASRLLQEPARRLEELRLASREMADRLLDLRVHIAILANRQTRLDNPMLEARIKRIKATLDQAVASGDQGPDGDAVDQGGDEPMQVVAAAEARMELDMVQVG